jgi:flavin reductase (DIM6/NTAB) family NADH-FMN oxidoreductase RutF
MTTGKTFCINLLSEHHGDLSFAFGGKIPPEDRFATGKWSEWDGRTPYLDDAQANLFCHADALYEYGTHSIVIGKVKFVRIHGEVRPLVYADGRFVPITLPL